MPELAPGVHAQVPGASRLVAGFWVRLLADFLDAIILGIFGFCLALPFRNFLFRLGESGVWIGLVVTFLYAGLLQSAIGHGQSLAKQVLKIQVLKMDGHYLSLPSSLLRYTVIALIFYNAWIGLALTSVFPILNHPAFQTAYAVGVMVLVVGTVLMVPLHPLKRGIHDLISGSIVVYKGTFDAERIVLLRAIPPRFGALIWFLASVGF
jgi:uncharacterized RDD family membrane protein YckC